MQARKEDCSISPEMNYLFIGHLGPWVSLSLQDKHKYFFPNHLHSGDYMDM